MKSQGSMLLSIAESILYDSILACDHQEREVVKDINRLSVGFRTRGQAFFLLDLPLLDAVLTSALESGTLSASGPLTGRRSKADCRPRFLHGLWSRVFDHSGSLKENADPNAIFFIRSIVCLGKKIAADCSPNRVKAVLEDYHAIESEILPPVLDWTSDCIGDFRPDISFVASFGGHDEGGRLFREANPSHNRTDLTTTLGVLDRVCRVLSLSFGEFNPITGEEDSRGGRFKHGPGAVADLGKGGFKYSFPTWPQKLENLFPYDWCGSHSIDVGEVPSAHEPPSRLIAVPKTAKGPRLIASEPTSHQWCQQKVLTWIIGQMETSILGEFIDLKAQEASQKLVRSASIHRDLSTLDLSSASDRVSCRHVEALFRSNHSLLRACHASRTRWVSDTMSEPPIFLKIKKFAAMGSALTFPVQSIFFLACCLASCDADTEKKMKNLVGKVRVYGDDLIVPTYAYARLTSLLHHLGLKVNVAKSFSQGYFRESCGLDCFKGHDVTPVKPKTLVADTPERCQSLVDTVNNLHKKGLWQASARLESTLRTRGFLLPVVGPDSGVAGLVSFCGPDVSSLQVKYNRDLQKVFVRMHSLRKSTVRETQHVSATLTQYFTENPDPDIIWKSGVARNRVATFAPRWVDLEQVA